jgi:tetratricopeptide (TPR) repeat protein
MRWWDVMGRASIGGMVFAILAVVSCTAAAQDPATQDPGTKAAWETCLKTPTRGCVLDQALTLVLSYQATNQPPEEPATLGKMVAAQLKGIAEAHAGAGDIEAALRVAALIPKDHRSQASALRVIAGAQAKLGLTDDARDTFVRVRMLADSLSDPLDRAEALQSIAKAEAEAGMTTEADSSATQALALAETLEMPAPPPCVASASPELRLDLLLKRLAEQKAKAGQISGSLRAARSIKYAPEIRAEALVAIAAAQVQGGRQSEAGPILKEAAEAALAAPTMPQHGPNCLSVRHGRDYPDFQVRLLGAVAKMQAEAGAIEDATATLQAALQFVPTIGDGSFLSADVLKSIALAKIALAQHEAGLKSQSAATFERAAQAAAAVSDPKSLVWPLAEQGRAKAKTGSIQEATAMFDQAQALARSWPDGASVRAARMLYVFNAKATAGLAVDADDTPLQALQATRSIPAKTRRAMLLRRIAQALEKQGLQQDAAAAYREALEAADAGAGALFSVIRCIPGFAEDPRSLLAQTAPQAIEAAQSIKGDLSRAEALVVIAEALPN